MKNFFCAIILAFSSTSFAFINGEFKSEYSNSAMGLMYSGFLCSGAKVADKIILTARHCIQGKMSVGTKLRLLKPASINFATRTSNEDIYDNVVTEIDFAPFDESRGQFSLPDIALVYVRDPMVGWSETARIGYVNARDYENLWTAGFGCKGVGITDPTITYTGRLKKPKNVTASEIQFDASTTGFDQRVLSFSCPGDSGGPIIRRLGGRDTIVAVIKGISFKETEFVIDKATGNITKLPTAEHDAQPSYQAEKILSESKSTIRWLEKRLGYLAFSWD